MPCPKPYWIISQEYSHIHIDPILNQVQDDTLIGFCLHTWLEIVICFSASMHNKKSPKHSLEANIVIIYCLLVIR